MAWDRKVKVRIVLYETLYIPANREEYAREEAMRRVREEYGHDAHLEIITVTPEGDWCPECLGPCKGEDTHDA